MSSKQAKRLRKTQRKAGIEPALDRKRRLRQERHDKFIKDQNAAAKYRRENPDGFRAQQLRLQSLLGVLGIIGI
jgi:hypothetical protein